MNGSPTATKLKKPHPIMMDAKRPTPRHIIIKMPKVRDKERILKVAGEKQLVTYRGRNL